MKTKLFLTLAAFTAFTLHAEPVHNTTKTDPKPDAAKNKVQIAILLDTSNSMDGLIDQARTQLWKIVNSFSEAKRDGQTPLVEVALYEYGNESLHIGNNYIRQIESFTRDLDEVSKELFALKTNGGEEYCGAVIQRALDDLSWDTSDKTYKAIFIAGNEPFNQGSVNPQEACKASSNKNIIVNTIHCGSRDEGITGSWHDGAALADGKYMVIDQDRAVTHIDAPQDKEIAELSLKLNETYISYGSLAKEGIAKQKNADKDATSNRNKGADIQRAIAKSSSAYHNANWDAVDAYREKKIDLHTAKVEELPAEMQKMSADERIAYIEKAAKEREAIQQKILELNKQREAYIAAASAKQASTAEQTLDEAIVGVVQQQLQAKGYICEK